MLNVNLLKAAIAAKGLRQGDIAKKLDLSAGCFSRKVNGKVPFNTDELSVLISELDIESSFLTIFFGK